MIDPRMLGTTFRILLLLAGALLLASTGGCVSTPAQAGACAPRAGYYVLTFQEQPGGTCGARAPELREEGQPTPLPAGCVRDDLRYDADDCWELEANRICSTAGGSTSVQVEWSADGARGAGEAQVVRDDCRSDYTVTAEKLP